MELGIQAVRLLGGKEFYTEQTVIAKVLSGEHVSTVINQTGPQRDRVVGVRSESWQGLNYAALWSLWWRLWISLLVGGNHWRFVSRRVICELNSKMSTVVALWRDPLRWEQGAVMWPGPGWGVIEVVRIIELWLEEWELRDYSRFGLENMGVWSCCFLSWGCRLG